MQRVFGALAASLMVVALSSCGGPGAPVGIPSQFGDADPYDWRGHARPDRYDVHGIDVSRWQGNIDWNRVAGSGVSFAFIKATEGGDVADPMFLQNWEAARRAGLPRGAYHFYYFCRPAEEQAAWFIGHVPRESGALPPVLDIEWTASRNCPKRPDADWVRAEATRFVDILTAYYGQRPIIYTTVDFWRDNHLYEVQGYEFWLRSVAGHPAEVFPGHNWHFWQYTGTGLVRGINGQTDLNAFKGTPDDWALWLAMRQQL